MTGQRVWYYCTMHPTRHIKTVALAAGLFVLCTGCVRRTVMVTSTPPGALVYLNDREVGRTPCEVDFTYYGRYDVRLVRDGCEPVQTFADANPPLWDVAGPDLIAAAMPFELRSSREWHFDLVPVDTDPAAMADRARQLHATLPGPSEPAEQSETDEVISPSSDQPDAQP